MCIMNAVLSRLFDFTQAVVIAESTIVFTDGRPSLKQVREVLTEKEWMLLSVIAAKLTTAKNATVTK
jgi:hypothetical protein